MGRDDTMPMAIRIHEFGDSSVLRADDVPRPEYGPGEMLVRIHAASVNPVDYKIRQGGFPPVTEDKLPYTMGRDVAGVVEAKGELVNSFDADAAIYAMLGPDRGGYAEYVVVKPTEAAAIPQTLTQPQAAAVPLAALTAWQGLFDHGGLTEGQTVLIHGGAGGVGHLAVQIAKARGATVLTTARAEDVDMLQNLGADRVIDYRTEAFEEIARDVDLVLDLVAGETQERSFQVLREGGTLVSTLAEPSQAAAREKNIRTAVFMAEPNGTQLEEIARLINQGQVSPVVADTLPLTQAAEAQDRLEREHIQGKLVLQVL